MRGKRNGARQANVAACRMVSEAVVRMRVQMHASETKKMAATANHNPNVPNHSALFGKKTKMLGALLVNSVAWLVCLG